MVSVPEPLLLLQAAAEGLDAFLKLQTVDSTPVILTQPPSARNSRRESLNTAFESLDAQMTLVQRLRDSINASHNVILHRRAMCQAALQPVSALPPEILRMIFAYLHNANTRDTSIARTLSNVCTDWRQVALGYQRIWSSSTIIGTDDIPKLALPLSLSGEGDFHLTVSKLARGDIVTSGDTDTDLLRRTLCERLATLRWYNSEDPNRFFWRIRDWYGRQEVSFPSLRRMFLYPNGDVYAAEHGMDFTRIGLPSLVHLEIGNIRIIKAGSIMSQLKYLSLAEMRLPFTFLRVLLREAAQLEELQIKGSKMEPYDAPSHFSPAHEVNLPRLNLLDMNTDYDDDIVRTVLGFFCFPILRHLSVYCTRDSEYDESRGTPWHHRPTELTDAFLQRATLPNSLYKVISSVDTLERIDLHMPHNAIKAAIGALSMRQGGALAATSLSSLSLELSDPLGEHTSDAPRYVLRAAHTGDIARGLGDLLKDALELRNSVSHPLAELHISSCIGEDGFDELVTSVTVRDPECSCPFDHYELFDSDSDEDEDEDD